jgi:hypothetical protein
MDIKDLSHTVHDEEVVQKPIQHDAVGTVRLVNADEIVLIPTPSPDPRGMHWWTNKHSLDLTLADPLNLPEWRKWVITCTLGLCKLLCLSHSQDLTRT